MSVFDREAFVPVRCNEVDSKFAGGWYWEPVKSVIELNGAQVKRERKLRGNDFKAGDKVVVRYMSKTYSGVVIDPDAEPSLQSPTESILESMHTTVGNLQDTSETISSLATATSLATNSLATAISLATNSLASTTSLATSSLARSTATSPTSSSQATVTPPLASAIAGSTSAGSGRAHPPPRKRRKQGKNCIA